MESGQTGEHEQSSVPRHLRLLLSAVVSLVPRSAPEWQGDSCLYRAPEEGASASIDSEKTLSTLGNIVCVLNREVERICTQQRVDHEKMQ